MKLIMARIKKLLRIQSPSTMLLGYRYEYDYLMAIKSRESVEQKWRVIR